jgi:8-oxo-dGTP pyrophosphatase MutT (NUDIX family)
MSYKNITKLAGKINEFRDRASLFLHDGKGNVLAAKNDIPSIHEAPFHFPGGGVHKEESLHNPIPTVKQVNKGLHREALEELGYKIHNIEHFGHDPHEMVMNPEWQRRVYQKRGERYQGIREHMRAAQIHSKDDSLYNIEGDSFNRFNPEFVPANELANALRQHASNELIFPGKRENMIRQADFLDKIHNKYSKKK